MNEFELIRNLKTLFPRIGDDAESFKFSYGNIQVVSIDSFVENVHFDNSYFSSHDIGYKSTSASMSDIAAVGGRPKYILISLGMPEGDLDFVNDFSMGVIDAVSKFEAQVIGGDTVQSDRIFVSVCVIGETERMIRRSGARIGDLVCTTGPTGRARAGYLCLKKGIKDKVTEYHLRPTPKIEEGVILSRFASSMIDISDGLVIDLSHILEESGVGARLENIPIDHELEKISPLIGESTVEMSMYGGEDFELLFTIDRAMLQPLERELEVIKIGEIIPKGFFDPRGKPIVVRGYEHFSH
jgi:thiamine-monophosphate kinase